ncbi:histidine kinase [soil metagenome]
MSATVTAPGPDWHAWAPDAAAGGIVMFMGLYEAATAYAPSGRLPLVLVALATALAVGLSRHRPGVALGLVWVTFASQLLTGEPLMLVQLAVAAVAFGTARWGSPATVVASALSIPAAALGAVLAAIAQNGSGLFSEMLGGSGYRSLARFAYGVSDTWQTAVALVGIAVLGLPWLAGLALRFSARASASQVSQTAAEENAARAQRESEQAREIARLRDEQARLARDVHDVVGHSLAVILAQAESAQYLPDDDPDALKATMATIATSARGSLQDVRQVLSATQQPGQSRPGGLDSLIEGVRASGHEVLATEVGIPQPLPPELEVVAFRVLQEMLTNAIRHGRRDRPVQVERHWPDVAWQGDLRIEVINGEHGHLDDTRPLQVGDLGGQGVQGMQRRLEAVGGRIDVRRREESDGATFTVTAWVPVRTVVR